MQFECRRALPTKLAGLANAFMSQSARRARIRTPEQLVVAELVKPLADPVKPLIRLVAATSIPETPSEIDGG